MTLKHINTQEELSVFHQKLQVKYDKIYIFQSCWGLSIQHRKESIYISIGGRLHPPSATSFWGLHKNWLLSDGSAVKLQITATSTFSPLRT